MFGKYIQPIIEKAERIRLAYGDHPERVFERNMERQLFEETWKYIKDNMSRASYLQDWKAMFSFVAPRLADGEILEFGVARGKTINYLSALLPYRQLRGFDSFESFPEPYIGWEASHDAFDFKGALPFVRDNVKLVKGFFSETLPEYAGSSEENIAFIHVDCDLYSSTMTVLNELKHRMRDTYIQFDEYFNYWCWQEHECKAFHEFKDQNPSLNFEFVAFTWRQVLVKVTAR
jgi:hypothetical protein